MTLENKEIQTKLPDEKSPASINTTDTGSSHSSFDSPIEFKSHAKEYTWNVFEIDGILILCREDDFREQTLGRVLNNAIILDKNDAETLDKLFSPEIININDYYSYKVFNAPEEQIHNYFKETSNKTHLKQFIPTFKVININAELINSNGFFPLKNDGSLETESIGEFETELNAIILLNLHCYKLSNNTDFQNFIHNRTNRNFTKQPTAQIKNGLLNALLLAYQQSISLLPEHDSFRHTYNNNFSFLNNIRANFRRDIDQLFSKMNLSEKYNDPFKQSINNFINKCQEHFDKMYTADFKNSKDLYTRLLRIQKFLDAASDIFKNPENSFQVLEELKARLNDEINQISEQDEWISLLSNIRDTALQHQIYLIKEYTHPNHRDNFPDDSILICLSDKLQEFYNNRSKDTSKHNSFIEDEDSLQTESSFDDFSPRAEEKEDSSDQALFNSTYEKNIPSVLKCASLSRKILDKINTKITSDNEYLRKNSEDNIKSLLLQLVSESLKIEILPIKKEILNFFNSKCFAEIEPKLMIEKDDISKLWFTKELLELSINRDEANDGKQKAALDKLLLLSSNALNNRFKIQEAEKNLEEAAKNKEEAVIAFKSISTVNKVIENPNNGPTLIKDLTYTLSKTSGAKKIAQEYCGLAYYLAGTALLALTLATSIISGGLPFYIAILTSCALHVTGVSLFTKSSSKGVVKATEDAITATRFPAKSN